MGLTLIANLREGASRGLEREAIMADTAAARARLIEIIKERSFQSGKEITLASGRTSTYYFNMKPTMLDAEGAHLIGTLILDAIDGLDADLVGGLEMGAVPIAAAVAAVSFGAGKPVGAFFVRKQAKEHGTKSLIEGLPAGATMAGKRVVVVEDVTTTGGSAIKAAETLRSEGAEVLCVVTVVDRQEGAGEAFDAAGLKLVPILTLEDFK
jgi:orotate phosphoribosyltransferase